MTGTRGMNYAFIVAAAFVLWVPVALFGGQGYSALLALAAIPAAFKADWRRPSRPAIALMLVALWAALSGFWSPEVTRVASGSLTEGTFSINAAGLRIILTALAAILVLAATLKIDRVPRLAVNLLFGALIVHGAATLLIALLPELTLAAYAPFSDPVKEAPQNILRSTNSFCLGLPLLLGACLKLQAPWRLIAAAGLVVVAAIACFLIGSDVAVLGVLFLLLAYGVLRLAPRNGFRILLGIIALAIITAPLVLSTAGPAVIRSDIPISASSKSRIFAWSLATQKIGEHPVIGHGIEASKEWRDRFADRPELLELMRESTDLTDIPWEKYRILPGHPHNMGLQLWAETGLVGVGLAVLALLLLALALPPPTALSGPVVLAAGGLIGVAFALFGLSYSVWNEAFWANLTLASAGIVLMHRTARLQ